MSTEELLKIKSKLISVFIDLILRTIYIWIYVRTCISMCARARECLYVCIFIF